VLIRVGPAPEGRDREPGKPGQWCWRRSPAERLVAQGLKPAGRPPLPPPVAGSPARDRTCAPAGWNQIGALLAGFGGRLGDAQCLVAKAQGRPPVAARLCDQRLLRLQRSKIDVAGRQSAAARLQFRDHFPGSLELAAHSIDGKAQEQRFGNDPLLTHLARAHRRARHGVPPPPGGPDRAPAPHNRRGKKAAGSRPLRRCQRSPWRGVPMAPLRVAVPTRIMRGSNGNTLCRQTPVHRGRASRAGQKLPQKRCRLPDSALHAIGIAEIHEGPQLLQLRNTQRRFHWACSLGLTCAISDAARPGRAADHAARRERTSSGLRPFLPRSCLRNTAFR